MFVQSIFKPCIYEFYQLHININTPYISYTLISIRIRQVLSRTCTQFIYMCNNNNPSIIYINHTIRQSNLPTDFQEHMVNVLNHINPGFRIIHQQFNWKDRFYPISVLREILQSSLEMHHWHSFHCCTMQIYRVTHIIRGVPWGGVV